MLAKLCPQEKALLQALKAQGVQITAYNSITAMDNWYDGTKWTTQPCPLGGTQDGNNLTLVKTGDVGLDASTIYHEGTHAQQPSAWDWAKKESDAYTKEDQWRERQNPKIPPMDASWRNPDGTTNTPNIEKSLSNDRTYPGMAVQTTPGGPPQEIIGRTPDGKKVRYKINGVEQPPRKPQLNDAYPGTVTIYDPPGGIKVDINQLQCCP
jgi:hypothetical protein